MMRYFTWLSIAQCLCFTGCNRAALVKKVVPQEDEVFARKYVELLRHRAFDQIEPKLYPKHLSLRSRTDLLPWPTCFQMRNRSPQRLLPTISIIPSPLEYEFPEQWLLVDISVKRVCDYSTITSFRVTPIPDSLNISTGSVSLGKAVCSM